MPGDAPPKHPLISSSRLALIREATEMEHASAQDAGAIAYMARLLVQVTMPHSRPETDRHMRTNGGFTIQMLAGDANLGLPYGSTPRLILAWMTTEAVKTQSPTLHLGTSFNEFLQQIGLVAPGACGSGGKRGVRTYALRQAMALFNAIVSWNYADAQNYRGNNVPIASEYRLAWDPLRGDQRTLWDSTVTMGEAFFKEVTARPVPVDFRALKLFRRSPMRLDIYSWLTYRMSYLERATTIPWEALQGQFGADYPLDAQGLRNFKKAFLEHLKLVRVVYHDASIEQTETGLLLKPSPTHITARSISAP